MGVKLMQSGFSGQELLTLARSHWEAFSLPLQALIILCGVQPTSILPLPSEMERDSDAVVQVMTITWKPLP